MALFEKNENMPTLSLSWICVFLFLFILALSQLTVPPLYSQDLRNRTEEMYPFGTVIIAKEPLPDKVYEAQKNKIMVSVVFLEKETSNIITSSVGTGFVTETPGTIITVRHLLDGVLVNVENLKKNKIESNPKFDYTYVFIGTIITDLEWINFPLFLVAKGEIGTFKDMMVLRTDVVTMQRAQRAGDILNPNPYSILIKTSKFMDANIGEKIYITGFAPVLAEHLNKNNQPVSVYLDLINFTFQAEVTAPISNMPANKAGVKKLYRLLDGAEPGFSGGKVINSQGQVVGMTMAVSILKNFIYILSSQDIKQFLKDNKLK